MHPCGCYKKNIAFLAFVKVAFKGVRNGENFFAAQNASDAKIRLREDGSISLRSTISDQGFIATESGRYGSASFSKALKGLKNAGGPNEFKRVILQYKDSDGDAHIDVMPLGRDEGGVTLRDGKLNIKSKVFSNSEYSDGKYDRISGGSNFQTSALNGAEGDSREHISDLRLYFDTFTRKQLREFARNQRIESKEGIASIRIEGKQLRGLDASEPDGSTISQQEFILFDESYDFDDSDASAGIELSITPDFSASIVTPDVEHWYDVWEYLDPTLYSFSLNAGLTWSALAVLDPGTSDGQVTLVSQSYDGPQFAFPVAGIVNGDIASGFDFSAGATIGALNQDNYQFSASQYLGFIIAASGNGLAFTNQSDPFIETQYPSIDELTGLQFNADASPWLDLTLGIGVSIPYFGDVDFATAGLELGLPIGLNLALLPAPVSLVIDVAGNLTGTATIVPFISGGISLDSPQFSLFNITTGNLLA